MTFLIGLGNPGLEYEKTRHNVGFVVIDELCAQLTEKPFTQESKSSPRLFSRVAKVGDCILAQPQTFMNESGKAVRATLDFYQKDLLKEGGELKNLFVIHDDLDLALGSYKLHFAKGPKIHNGLQSIYDHLHTDQFWHVRVGVDGRGGVRSMPGHAYVLSQFTDSEKEVLTTILKELVPILVAKIVR